MRHVTGLVVAIVVAAALYFGGGWGVSRASGATAHAAAAGQTSLLSQTGLIGLAVLVGVGLVIGIAMAVRAISPLGSGLPGLLLLAWTALLAVKFHRAAALVPMAGSSYGAGFKTVLDNGVLGLVGMAMVVPLFVPSRWRGRRHGEDSDDEDADYVSTHLLS
jgi:hypothetical protein